MSKYTSTFKKEKNVWLIPISNARFFYFFLKETEARGRNWTPNCCLKGRQILVQHHKQHTPLHSWNSDKNQFRLAAGGKKTSKKEAPGSSRLEFPLWLVYWIIQKLSFFFFFLLCFIAANTAWQIIHVCVISRVTRHWYSLDSRYSIPLDPGLGPVMKKTDILPQHSSKVTICLT